MIAAQDSHTLTRCTTAIYESVYLIDLVAMDIGKRLLVIVVSLAGGMLIMFALWQMFTGKAIQIDLTEPSFVLFWVFFSVPVYAYMSRKFLRKPRRYKTSSELHE